MSSIEKTGRRPRRRLFFAAVMVSLIVVVCELAAFVGLSINAGRVIGPSDIRKQRAAASTEGSGVLGESEEVTVEEWYPHHTIHPYIGFVYDRNFMSDQRLAIGGEESLNYGFILSQPGLFHERRPDGLILAVTGGSVAFNFARDMTTLLRRKLGASMGLPAKNVVVINIAQSGLKQPQQLMTVNYLLSLGLELDVLVNIDGFNEIAQPPTENVPFGVAASYPRGWQYRVADFDLETRLVTAELASVSRKRVDLARTFDRRLLRSSLVAGLVWSVLDGRLERRLDVLELKMAHAADGNRQSYAVTGPRREYRNRNEEVMDLVRLWSRSSRLLEGACTSAGIAYLHFLQPNQYLTNSKPMGRAELALAVAPESIRGKWVKLGYPRMIGEGRSLAADGVDFFDLTMMFAGTRKPTYKDACCHLNELGNTLLTDVVVDRTAEVLRASGTGLEPTPPRRR